MKNLKETFTYDMNRLTGITLRRSSGQDLHCAVTYDALGRMISWQADNSFYYTYGYDHQRIRMEEHIGNNTRTIQYILKDNLGSWTTITDGDGVVEQRLSYDAWGNLRNPNTWSGNFSGTPMFDRGYTLHKHYDGFDLINMKFTLSERSAKLCLSTAERCELGGANGRLYDPILGRMLSPDIVVQDEQNSQAYNRYSYCFNNPLRFTDPSGYVVRGSRNYYDWNSMVYYDFGNHRNNGSAFNTDLSEGKFSPIYDVNGYFLGTDDEGLQGEAIVMRREDFRQGMSHKKALSLATDLDENNKDAEIRLYSHFSQLGNRPDWDGYLTKSETDDWWLHGNGNAILHKTLLSIIILFLFESCSKNKDIVIEHADMMFKHYQSIEKVKEIDYVVFSFHYEIYDVIIYSVIKGEINKDFSPHFHPETR